MASASSGGVDSKSSKPPLVGSSGPVAESVVLTSSSGPVENLQNSICRDVYPLTAVADDENSIPVFHHPPYSYQPEEPPRGKTRGGSSAAAAAGTQPPPPPSCYRAAPHPVGLSVVTPVGLDPAAAGQDYAGGAPPHFHLGDDGGHRVLPGGSNYVLQQQQQHHHNTFPAPHLYPPAPPHPPLHAYLPVGAPPAPYHSHHPFHMPDSISHVSPTYVHDCLDLPAIIQANKSIKRDPANSMTTAPTTSSSLPGGGIIPAVLHYHPSVPRSSPPTAAHVSYPHQHHHNYQHGGGVVPTAAATSMGGGVVVGGGPILLGSSAAATHISPSYPHAGGTTCSSSTTHPPLPHPYHLASTGSGGGGPHHIYNVPSHLVSHASASELVREGRMGNLLTSPGSTCASIPRHLPRVDVMGDNDVLLVEVELPGVEKEDVIVKLEGNDMLSVTATTNFIEPLPEGVLLEKNSQDKEKHDQHDQHDQQHEDNKDQTSSSLRVVPAQWHVQERRRGIFERSLKLPSNLAVDQMHAKFEKGVLQIRIPKKKEIHVNVH